MEHEPLDDVDAAILEELRATYEDLDPVPDDLVERVKFSLALDEMFEEVARMTRVPVEELAVRGEQTSGTRTETLTFSAERLTAMVTVSRIGPGRLRIDGWLAPNESCRVRLRIQGGVVAGDDVRRRWPLQLRGPRRGVRPAELPPARRRRRRRMPS